MKTRLGLIASLFAAAAMVGCVPKADTPDDKEEEAVGESREALASESRLCCTNIDGWGSVVYYQENAGTDAWVTTSTLYHQGTLCPYWNNTCRPVLHVGFDVSNTNSATQNYATFDINLNAGDQLQLGGCQPGASFSGDTYVRLFDGESEVASNDDSCGLGSQISFGAPHTGTYSAHLGCYSSGSCSGEFGAVITPTDWVYCSAESSTCNITGTKLVRFGHDTRWNYQVATGSVGCNNSQFGDPAYGEFKDCYYTDLPTDTWVQCAEEYQTCNYSGNVTIAYGTGTTWTYATGTAGSVFCDNSVFGDPAVGAMKYCYIKQM